MPNPESHIETDRGEGVTYDCGCPCTPTAVPSANGTAGSEHCCCGKVHFAGLDASTQLDVYLEGRKATRKREPDYDRGATFLDVGSRQIEVASGVPPGLIQGPGQAVSCTSDTAASAVRSKNVNDSCR